MKCTRLGTKYGGWNVPLEMLSKDSTCYCVGCGKDISFDLALIETIGCHVFAFDPTPESVAYVAAKVKNNNKYHFQPVGLWHSDEEVSFYTTGHRGVSCSVLVGPSSAFTAPCKRLATLMGGLGHDHLDLLKMDIEGAEYAVLQDMCSSNIGPRILCVEFHGHAGAKPPTLTGYTRVHRIKRNFTFVWSEDA